MSENTPGIEAMARAFLEACDTGQGREACRPFCTPSATFECQAEPLAEVSDLGAYTEWMKDIVGVLSDARYSIKAIAANPGTSLVLVHALIQGTHTGEGGPVPPTGLSICSDYVYVMRFEDSRISHLTKIWNSGWALNQLGWT